MDKLIKQINRRRTTGVATTIISVSYLASRLLGLLRDRLLIAQFGKGGILDAYNSAFRLPEILFALLVSGAFAVAFIPVFNEHYQNDKQQEAWDITTSLLNLLVLGTVVGGVLIAIFADPLTTLMSGGFDPERHKLTVELTRIMLITPVLFSISSVLGSVQQAFSRFFIYAFAGILYNLGIIAGIHWLAPRYSVYGVAWGVVLGVVLQALLQWLGLWGLGFKYKPMLGLRLKGVRQTLKLMVPRSLDQGIDQINYAFETLIGSTLSRGSITAFTLANNLKNVPMALITNSITTAVFPKLVSRAGQGKREELVQVYVQTARLILFMIIPSAGFAVIGRGYIVRLLYGFGDLDTANTLGWFAGTIIFTSLFLLVSRIYYAMQDTRTPLYLSLVSIALHVVLSMLLSRWYGVTGLAMAASLVSAFEALGLITLLRLRQGQFGGMQILSGAWRMLLSAGIMSTAMYLSIATFLPLRAVDRGFMTLAPKFGLLFVIGLLSYLVPCYLLRLTEAHTFWRRLRDVLYKSLDLV